LIIRQKYKVEL